VGQVLRQVSPSIVLQDAVVIGVDEQAWQDDLRNYLKSEECLRTAELVACLV
jgi:hypothetical protein